MPSTLSPWRKDFETVPASVRRAARYALLLVRDGSSLHDRDVLGALWQLSLPLLAPRRLRPSSPSPPSATGNRRVFSRTTRSRNIPNMTVLFWGVYADSSGGCPVRS